MANVNELSTTDSGEIAYRVPGEYFGVISPRYINPINSRNIFNSYMESYSDLTGDVYNVDEENEIIDNVFSEIVNDPEFQNYGLYQFIQTIQNMRQDQANKRLQKQLDDYEGYLLNETSKGAASKRYEAFKKMTKQQQVNAACAWKERQREKREQEKFERKEARRQEKRDWQNSAAGQRVARRNQEIKDEVIDTVKKYNPVSLAIKGASAINNGIKNSVYPKDVYQRKVYDKLNDPSSKPWNHRY